MIAILDPKGKPPHRSPKFLVIHHPSVRMISRQWRGIAKPGRAAEYIHHLESQTFRALEKIPGFVAASILTRQIGESTEFLIITEWESLDAIHGFAGLNVSVAVVPEAARALLSSFDEYVVHYEIERRFDPTKH